MKDRTILIVDDFAEDRESVAIALRQDPQVRYRILEAATGDQGLRILEEQSSSIDLVFLDFRLPDMNANDFVDKLLRGRDVPPVPIIVLTGSLPTMFQGLESLRRGVQDFFTKLEASSSIVSRIAQNAIERHKLLQQVVESERRASEASDKAARADRAKSQFLALISHELRTPLTAILGFCRLLEQDLDCPQREEMLRTVIGSGEHLEELLNDLIDIAKVEAGTLELDPTEFDPRKLVRTTISLLSKRATDKGIRVDVDLDLSTPPAVRADAMRFRQILVNLIGNAIKFTDSGSVLAKVTWDAGTEMLELGVTDTGPGIPEEMIPNLFTPFKQGGLNSERKRSGAGLGLAISHQLARMMGGDLRLESTSERGTAFTASLEAPRVVRSGPQEATSDSDVSQPVDLAGKRIVAADDIRANRFLLERLLSPTAAEITMVDDGAAVLEVIGTPEQPRADLVILDMLMPVLDGYETTRELRRRGFTFPIIALTAAASTTDHDTCLEAGCDTVVTKPIDVRTLFSTLHRALQSSNE
ncbi:Autoinducer 2 sensor kinase/phosphatase LuxQ [Planctomycetes bacterium Pan216]|uniref:histidine kinase n=1 Tax=Kolteria novifilia TaxID=2527975 RepID=A0A518B724_9BACT|nr:Autoinducer 2 sensor kinase/phosphatase LuxQ [Planctomycetes bacterium Pan216]